MDYMQEVKVNYLFQIQTLTSVQKGITYSGIKIYNSLANNVLSLQNDRKSFKNELHSYLLGNSFYCQRIPGV